MKKYLFGALALVLAVGFSAFTKPSTTSRIFQYSPTTPGFTKALVETESNWVLTTVACTAATPQKACSVEIDVPAGQESSYYNTSTGRLIAESGTVGVDILATQHDPLTFYVADVEKSNVTIVNQLHNILK